MSFINGFILLHIFVAFQIASQTLSTGTFYALKRFYPLRPPSVDTYYALQTLFPLRLASTDTFYALHTLFPSQPPSDNTFYALKRFYPSQPPSAGTFYALTGALQALFPSQLPSVDTFRALPTLFPSQSPPDGTFYALKRFFPSKPSSGDTFYALKRAQPPSADTFDPSQPPSADTFYALQTLFPSRVQSADTFNALKRLYLKHGTSFNPLTTLLNNMTHIRIVIIIFRSITVATDAPISLDYLNTDGDGCDAVSDSITAPTDIPSIYLATQIPSVLCDDNNNKAVEFFMRLITQNARIRHVTTYYALRTLYPSQPPSAGTYYALQSQPPSVGTFYALHGLYALKTLYPSFKDISSQYMDNEQRLGVIIIMFKQYNKAIAILINPLCALFVDRIFETFFHLSFVFVYSSAFFFLVCFAVRIFAT